MIQTSHTTSSFFVKTLMNGKKTLGTNDSTLFPRVFCDDQMLIFLFAIRFFLIHHIFINDRFDHAFLYPNIKR